MRITVIITKLILCTLLFLCLLKMPYSYFQFVRYAMLIGFAFLAYYANERKNKIEMIICICLVLLFQPFFKIALGRELWNVIDIIVGLALIASIFYKPKTNE